MKGPRGREGGGRREELMRVLFTSEGSGQEGVF